MKFVAGMRTKLTENGKISKKRVAGTVLITVIASLLLIYLVFAIYFQSHFCFRTTVNGVGVSANSASGVEKKINQQISKYSLSLEERSGDTEVIDGDTIQLTTVFDGTIQKLVKRQNGFAWPVLLFNPNEYTLDTMISYNQDELESIVSQLDCMDESKWTESKDAQISDYTSNGYEAIAEEYGTTIDKTAFMSALNDTLISLSDTLDMSESKCYVDPEITQESEEFKNTLDTFNKYVAVVITYDFGDTTEKLDGDTISTWLSMNDDGEVSIDEGLIAEYVKGLAKQYNTVYRTRTLDTSYGQTVSIVGGDYGWKIDNTAEADLIVEDLKEGASLEREPAYAQTANSHGDNDYGDTYVEINLTAQHLFFYKSGSLVVDTDFVSGNLANNHGTPVGAYSVTYKQKDATLKGQDYASDVSYWMPYCNDVGMHDASWRSAFGGSYYKRSGSHGCVNLPVSAAKTIYESIEAGYPVLVYELDGTESALGIAQDNAAAVDTAIGTIGDVTLDSAAIINSVQAQYDALTDQEKSFVKNLDVLTNAQATLGQLQENAANEAAAAQAAQAQEQAQADAQTVITSIDDIGEVTSKSEKKITTARAAYDVLSDAAKGYVTNYDKLTAAEEAFKEL